MCVYVYVYVCGGVEKRREISVSPLRSAALCKSRVGVASNSKLDNCDNV